MTERKLIEGWKEDFLGNLHGLYPERTGDMDILWCVEKLLQQQAELSFREGVEAAIKVIEKKRRTDYDGGCHDAYDHNATLSDIQDKLNSLTQEP